MDAARKPAIVGRALPHDSAVGHVAGRARYIDDIAVPADTLHLWVGFSEHAHAALVKCDLSAVRAAPGVVAVLDAADIPGINDVSPMAGDDPLFAQDVVEYVGQPIFVVAAESRAAARAAAAKAAIRYEPRHALIDIDEALAAESFVLPSKTMTRGDPTQLDRAQHVIEGGLSIGGQEHFYLEGQAAIALPGDPGELRVHSSTQHPTEAQHCIAKVLGWGDHKISVEVRRMGGAFGGKETQGAGFAAMAALVAARTGRAAKIVLDRDDDTIMTGKRHDFQASYRVGFDDSGRIDALDVELASRCGRSADLSGPVNDRAMFHVDNCCYLPNVRIVSHRLKTHTASNTAFRGFGGPQGMMVIEEVLDHIARHLGKDPLAIRQINLYDRSGARSLTPYGQQVSDSILPELFSRLNEQTDYASRRRKVDAYNASHQWLKRGLALTGVKFGISFTTTFLNQGGALVHVYSDGTIQVNHGGTEMGQGLHIKVAQVVAEEFQVDLQRISITATATDKVPNTSATAASSGSDINGKAAQNGARAIKERLLRFASEHWSVDQTAVAFEDNHVQIGDTRLTFAEFVMQAYLNRISLSATGFYRTPKIAYDSQTGKGRPFYYFAYGVALSEVVIDTLTGEMRVDAVDILHDVGDSLNPAVDLGQIEGGFIQGMGWLTTEELVWDGDGRLSTHAPSTYKIPTAGDRPARFNIAIYQNNPNPEDSIFRSKAVGEPPLMLAMSVFRAVSDAISYLHPRRPLPRLDAPATPERILAAIDAIRTL